MHPDMVVEERCLRAKYLAIWKFVHELGLGFVFGNPEDINVNLVLEFYAGYDPDDPKQYVPIWGRLIDFLAIAICNYLETPDVPNEPLGNFIVGLTCRDLRHTLCGGNSMAAWVRDKKTGRIRNFQRRI